jgi:hypothetical protein
LLHHLQERPAVEFVRDARVSMLDMVVIPVIGHKNPLWAIDGRFYSFPDVSAGGATIKMNKTIPGHLNISFVIGETTELEISVPIPARMSYSPMDTMIIRKGSAVSVEIGQVVVFRSDPNSELG